MERWDHASLLAAGSSPAKSAPPALDGPWFDSTWQNDSEPSEPNSPLGEGWELLDVRTFGAQLEPTVRHSGWLLKAYGTGAQRQWRRRYVYVLADRLCYTPDPGNKGPLRYLPLDRIPVRALPRGYGPKLGVTVIEDRQVDRSDPHFSPKKAGCVFSIACGAHTHFFAAPSPGEAKAWVAAITECWVSCVKHTARGTHFPSSEEVQAMKEARLQAENQALRRSLAEAEQQRMRESMAQWQAAAAAASAQTVKQEGLPVVCYEIEVVTGSQPAAGTTARVYLMLCGEEGSSGDHRLMYREGGTSTSPRTAFAAGATDRFKLHCQPLGELMKVRVYHNNGGSSPSWFLEEVRVRRQGGARWTHFPCRRWLAVDQDDSRVLRELFSAAQQAPSSPTVQPAPLQPAAPPHAPQQAQQEVVAPPAERVIPQVWYTVVVCTSGQEGAGLAAHEAAAVFLMLHGNRASSARVKLPSQPGDFERAQEDVFRVQLPSVGNLEKLTIWLSNGSEQAAWLLELVKVTDDNTGETVYFPCSAWLGKAKGAAERSLLGSRTNPREAHREVARLRQQLEAATMQLSGAQAELAEAKAAASGAQQATHGHEAEVEVKLAMQQAEMQQLQKQLVEAQQRVSAAEARAQQLQGELQQAAAKAQSIQKEQQAGRERADAESARAANLAAQLKALHDELAAAQEAAVVAAARARKYEGEARRGEEELEELRSQSERYRRDNSTRAADTEGQLQRLRAEVAAKAAEVQEARVAEQEAAEECDRLSRVLAVERLRAKEQLEDLREQMRDEVERAAQQADKVEKAAVVPPPIPATVKLLSTYRVCIRTSTEPSNAGTRHPVCLELLGSDGSSGTIPLRRGAASSCFRVGAADVFQLEAPAVGDLQQLNIWLDVERAGDAGASADAAWHLDTVEVVCEGRPPSCFVCRKWLNAGNSHRAELAASSRDPRQEEAEYKVIVHTSSLAGCGTSGNVFVDLKGERAPSGVLTLRNKGGSFRPGQADEFTFRLPSLGALCELRVGHDGRREWHLDKVEVVEAGTTYFFPCEQWVKSSGPGGSMSRSLQLRGYTIDPRSLPVQYKVEMAVEETSGRLGSDSLRLTLCGSRGESGAQRLDASRATPGRLLAAMFEGANVGQMERLRIGVALGLGGQQCGLRASSIVVTNMPSGEISTFHCSEWLRSADPYDFEVDAAEEQDEPPCSYRLEVQTSDVRRAGTAGNVYVTILGDACAIGPYQLTNMEAEHFQRGQLDVFEIEGAPDCGQLRQIEVRHDGLGRGNDWHLSWVKVANTTTGAVAMFKCKRWVDRRRREDPGAVGAAAPLPADAAAAAGGRLTAKDRLLLDGTTKAAAAALHAPVVQDVHMAVDMRRGAMDWTQEGSATVEEQAGSLLSGPEALPGYRVVFHTSRICGSGTRAKVHFELTGSGGSSGVLHPVGTSKSFGAGRVDIFDYPQLGGLGELQSARVGTDGSGFFPAWHLQLLVVTHLPTGRVWQFSCFNWVDKKCNYTRWLTLDSIQQGTHSHSGGSSGGFGTNLGTMWNSGQKPAALVTATSAGGFSTQGLYPPAAHRNSAATTAHYTPLGNSPIRYKVQQQQQQMLSGSPTGSASRLQVQQRQQQWGGGGLALPHGMMTMMRSGSLPGLPRIGARRPGSGR